MGFGLGLIHGRVEYTPKTAEVVYNCNLCGACDVSCKYAMEFDVLEPLYAMREECVEQRADRAGVGQARRDHAEAGPQVCWGRRGKRGQWFKDLEVKDYTDEKAAVDLPRRVSGEHRRSRAARSAAAAVSLLKKAGLDVGIAKDGELCCGGRAYEMGYATRRWRRPS